MSFICWCGECSAFLKHDTNLGLQCTSQSQNQQQMTQNDKSAAAADIVKNNRMCLPVSIATHCLSCRHPHQATHHSHVGVSCHTSLCMTQQVVSITPSMLLLNQTAPVFGIRGVASRESTHNDWQSTCSQHYMFEHILASEHRRDCSSNDVVMEGAGTLTPLASPSSTCYDNHVIRASHGLVQLQRKEDGSVMCTGKRNLMVSQ